MADDTITAISTPLGEGGIGIVRMSGRDAVAIATKIFITSKKKKAPLFKSHKLVHGYVRDPETDALIDEVLLSIMRAPHTYTGEDIAEINCHGGFLALRKVLELTMRSGCRLAEPGEFTKRAFLSGRIDLSQAEAVLDLIRAKSDGAQRIALEQLSGGLSGKITALRDSIAEICAHTEACIDFPEEEIEPVSLNNIGNSIPGIVKDLTQLSESFEEGRFFREGLKVAIVGRPNVGKSSLLNALLRRDRAIVTETPGTTRDIIEEHLNMKGLPVRIMDTAGIRQTHEMAEQEGVRRSLQAIKDADVVIGVLDGSTALHAEDKFVLEQIRDKKAIIAVNKSDLPAADNTLVEGLKVCAEHILPISATQDSGLDALKEKILAISLSGRGKNENASVIVTNLRHKTALEASRDALVRAGQALHGRMPLEIVAMELRDSLDRLGEVVGVVTTEDILNRIFSEFCIGK